MVLPSTPVSVLTCAPPPPPDDELFCALLLQPVAAVSRVTASSAAPAERLPNFTWSSLVLVGLTGHRWWNFWWLPGRQGPVSVRDPCHDGGTSRPDRRDRRVRRG